MKWLKWLKYVKLQDGSDCSEVPQGTEGLKDSTQEFHLDSPHLLKANLIFGFIRFFFFLLLFLLKFILQKFGVWIQLRQNALSTHEALPTCSGGGSISSRGIGATVPQILGIGTDGYSICINIYISVYTYIIIYRYRYRYIYIFILYIYIFILYIYR